MLSGLLDLQQHDGQVTGDRIAPQPRLAPSISGDHAGFGPQRCAGIENRAGQASVELRIGFGDVELAQHDLAVGPRHLERAIRQPPILVLFHQGMACGAILADAGDEIHRHGLFRREGDALPDGDDGIQHGSLGAGQRTVVAKRLWIGHAVAAADESRAIRFVRRFSDRPSMHCHEVHQAGYGFAVRARPARAQDRLSRAR